MRTPLQTLAAFAALVWLVSWCLTGWSAEPRGVFVLQGIDKQNVNDANIQAADGVSFRFSWAGVDKGSYRDWSWVDSQIARAHKYNKPVMLRAMAGVHSPEWIKGAWYKDAPLPWNTTAQLALAQFVAEMGRRYGSDPNLVCIHFTSTANWKSAEMHMADGLQNVSGYSDQKMIAAWSAGIDAYAAAFPNTPLSLNVSMEPNSKGAITYPVISYVQQLGWRATFQHNSLKASTSPTAKHHQLILLLGAQCSRTGYQMACPSSASRFGGTFDEALEVAGPDWDYLEVYQGDL